MCIIKFGDEVSVSGFLTAKAIVKMKSQYVGLFPPPQKTPASFETPVLLTAACRFWSNTRQLQGDVTLQECPCFYQRDNIEPHSLGVPTGRQRRQ